MTFGTIKQALQMSMDIGFVEPLVKLMGQQEMVNTIANADVDASYALEWPYNTSLYLGDVEAVFKHKEQAMSFLVELIGEELACSTMEWLQVSVKSVESKIEAFVVDSQSELESADGALMASLATFAVDAPRSDANALKALDDHAKDALAKAKRSAAKLNNYWPADLEEYKKLEVAHEDTKLFIIARGASDLLRRPGVSHVTKGKQVRDALKTIYEGRIKDSENKFLDDGFKARVEKLLSIDCASGCRCLLFGAPGKAPEDGCEDCMSVQIPCCEIWLATALAVGRSWQHTFHF